MVDQYKLRLGDGTVLAVDEQGLRTWLLDTRAMVQRPGSQAWRPLKEMLTALDRESAASTKPPAAASGPASALPLVQPSQQPPSPVAAPVSVPPAGRVVTAPLAESIARPGAKLDDGIPIIPFKRLDDDVPLPAAVPSGDLRDVAAAALEAEAPTAGPWQWPGGGPRTDVPPVDRVPTAADRAARSGRPQEPLTPVKTTGPTRILPTEGEVLVREGPIDPRAIAYPPVPGELAVRAAVDWGKDVVTKGREQIAHLPTPPIPELPRITEALGSPAARKRVRRAIVPALSVAAAVVLGLSAWAWWPRLRPAESGSNDKAAGLAPAPPVTVPVVPELPREVQEAVAQIPHLTPDTIQLVMASGATPTANPPELFRRAYIAASRGASALTDDEARELRALMNGVLGALRRVDRDRVRAYGRLTTQRDLLVEEDRKVLSLFARGVRALPAARRERLQELSGRSIAAGLPPPASPGTAAAAR